MNENKTFYSNILSNMKNSKRKCAEDLDLKGGFLVFKKGFQLSGREVPSQNRTDVHRTHWLLSIESI